MRAISIRIEPVRAGKRGWVSHDFRLKIPEYAAPNPPPGGRLALIHGRQPRPDLKDIAEKVKEARAVFRHKGGRPPHPAWGGILTLGHDAQRDVRDGRVSLEDLDQAALDALRDTFGASLVYVVRHRDEAAPHWHFLACNARPNDGRAWRFSRADLSRLQDRVAVHFEPFGWTRGRRKADRIADGEPVSRWTHRRVSELHQGLLADRERAEQHWALIQSAWQEAQEQRVAAWEASDRARAARDDAERLRTEAAQLNADAQREREKATKLREEAAEDRARAEREVQELRQRADALRGNIENREAKIRELAEAEDRISKRLAKKQRDLAAIEAAVAEAGQDRERRVAEIAELEERRARLVRAIAREEGRLAKIETTVAEVLREEQGKGSLPVSRATARRWAEAAVAKAIAEKDDEIHRLTVERDEVRQELEKVREVALDIDRRWREAEAARREAEEERFFYRSVLDAASGVVASPHPVPGIGARVRKILADAHERQAWAEAGLWWDEEREAIRAAAMTRKAAATALYAARKLAWGAVVCQPPEWAQIVATEAERRGIAIQVQALDANGEPTVLWSPPDPTPPPPNAGPEPADPKPR